MNEDRIVGAATTLAGQAQKGMGDIAGDRKLQADGLANQTRGTIQNTFGGAKDALQSVVERTSPELRAGAEKSISAVRNSPVLATLAMGAVGLLLAMVVRKGQIRNK